jgi:hypothetical protein
VHKTGREKEDKSARRAKIRALNDSFRKTFWGGRVLMTAGAAALENPVRNAVVEKIKAFDAFDDDNDPWGEHDFVRVEHDGQTFFAKIDLYERATVKHYSIAKPLLVSRPPAAGRRFRIVRSWPCASAHRLVSGESASTLFPQSVFTYAEPRKHRWRTKLLLGCKQPSIFPVASRLAAGAASSLIRFCSRASRSGLERCSLWNDAVFDEAPERYRKFPGQRDNTDLAAAHSLVAEALVPPQR